MDFIKNLKLDLIEVCLRTCDMNSALGSVVPLAMFFFLKKRRLSQNHFSAKRKNDRFSVICLSGPFWCYARPKNHGNEVFSWFSRKMCSKAKEGGECCTPLSNDFEEKKTWTPLMPPSLFPASPMEAHKATKCHLSIRNLENSRPPETIHKKKTKQKKKGEV